MSLSPLDRNWRVMRSCLTQGQRAVMFVFATLWSPDKPTPWGRVEHLADYAGQSPATFRRRLGELERLGVLRRSRRGPTGGQVFELDWDRLETLTDDEVGAAVFAGRHPTHSSRARTAPKLPDTPPAQDECSGPLKMSAQDERSLEQPSQDERSPSQDECSPAQDERPYIEEDRRGGPGEEDRLSVSARERARQSPPSAVASPRVESAGQPVGPSQPPAVLVEHPAAPPQRHCVAAGAETDPDPRLIPIVEVFRRGGLKRIGDELLSVGLFTLGDIADRTRDDLYVLGEFSVESTGETGHRWFRRDLDTIRRQLQRRGLDYLPENVVELDPGGRDGRRPQQGHAGSGWDDVPMLGLDAVTGGAGGLGIDAQHQENPQNIRAGGIVVAGGGW